MRPAPECVRFVARVHALVGAAMLAALALLTGLTANLPGVGFGPGTHFAAGLLGAFYGATAWLVWRGGPSGRALSTVASLLYVLRPPLAAQVRAATRDPAFAAHFAR
ncbi:MAG: hypothetical protein ACO3G4_08830 [Opitutaceae bacterium]